MLDKEKSIEGQEQAKESQETVFTDTERVQDWKQRCKDARDAIFNPNMNQLTFQQMSELQSIEDEHEFFALFGDFVLINAGQPKY